MLDFNRNNEVVAVPMSSHIAQTHTHTHSHPHRIRQSHKTEEQQKIKSGKTITLNHITYIELLSVWYGSVRFDSVEAQFGSNL